ncbi:MAG: hypothetical protein KKA70_15800 [Proteobacteria bacterium]|nr:hypothetical protein [Pseudomonadota bacterium]
MKQIFTLIKNPGRTQITVPARLSEPFSVDTLAAAFAKTGDFENAEYLAAA